MHIHVLAFFSKYVCTYLIKRWFFKLLFWFDFSIPRSRRWKTIGRRPQYTHRFEKVRLGEAFMIYFLHFSLFKALFHLCFLSMKDEQIWNFFADLDSTILRYHGCGRQNTFLQSTTDSHRNQITLRESKCCKNIYW